MTGVPSLWLPILLSAVAVFIASSVIHMLSPWHKSDYPRTPLEERILDALRPIGIAPGDYFMPRPASRQEMTSPEFTERMNRGPIVLMTVFPNGVPAMGKTLVLWFVYTVVVSALAAYTVGQALPPGGDHQRVMRIVGTVAFAGYAAALWQLSIWYRRSLSITVKSTVDGLIYAGLTAVIFAWLWP